MTEAVDHLIPVSVIIRRLENHRDELRRQARDLPWWSIKKSWLLSSSIATYEYEIEQILAISGSWQPWWKEVKEKRS